METYVHVFPIAYTLIAFTILNEIKFYYAHEKLWEEFMTPAFSNIQSVWSE